MDSIFPRPRKKFKMLRQNKSRLDIVFEICISTLVSGKQVLVAVGRPCTAAVLTAAKFNKQRCLIIKQNAVDHLAEISELHLYFLKKCEKFPNH